MHAWSVNKPEAFWGAAADFLKIDWQNPPSQVYESPADSTKMLGGQWFPDGRLNFAENLLKNPKDENVRIISIIEGRQDSLYFTGKDIYRDVSRFAHKLLQFGVKKGDRVAAVVPNTIEAIIGLLASSAIGAIWSSCSPDFGDQGILDRFQQIEPKVLILTTSYMYNGKLCDCQETALLVRNQLPSVQLSVSVDPLATGALIPDTVAWQEMIAPSHSDADYLPKYAGAFDDPLYILFSSGTTGKPKCIVHSVGGALLQQKKELVLHSDLSAGKRLLYFSTCGWMMWNWMVTGLSAGVDLVLFEGSITRNDCRVLWEAVETHKVNCFGTSAKFIATSIKAGVDPKKIGVFSALETVLSTGSPLLPEHFSWIYQQLKSNVHLASISGGTDIVSCFMLGNPWSPVYSGEIQGPGLGMAVECWNDAGTRVFEEKGELVCTKAFPAMPIGFWHDDGSKYFESYFAHFSPREVWRHGDYISMNLDLGITVFGRSDATLNPGGVRIGTAEIYRQVEQNPFIVDSLAVSRDVAGDAEMVLFVKLQPGQRLDADLEISLKRQLRTQLSPRHVPAAIFQVEDIPYTRSGKKLEIAVTRILHRQNLENITAIANPECLPEYERFRS